MPQMDTITKSAIMPQSISEAPAAPSFSPPCLLNIYLTKPQKNTTIARVMNSTIKPFNRLVKTPSILKTVWALAMAGRSNIAPASVEKLAIFARINIGLISLMYK